MRRCKNCDFWIKQNDELVKINAALGERNQALERICGEVQYGGLAQVLSLLSSEQIDEVKTFAEYLLSKELMKK